MNNLSHAKLAQKSKSIHSLSKKSTEARILTVNTFSPNTVLIYKNDKANIAVRSTKPLKRRIRKINEALPQTQPAWLMKEGHYTPGDGEFQSYHSHRPGADDHKKFKSKGFST